MARRRLDEYAIGDIVRSRAIGSKPAFVGEIAEICNSRTGYKASFYHVRDEAGELWHRRQGELALVAYAAKQLAVAA